MNQLYDLVSEKHDEGYILSYLQDHGVISDNCYKIFHVINDSEAYDFIRANYKDFLRWGAKHYENYNRAL